MSIQVKKTQEEIKVERNFFVLLMEYTEKFLNADEKLENNNESYNTALDRPTHELKLFGYFCLLNPEILSIGKLEACCYFLDDVFPSFETFKSYNKIKNIVNVNDLTKIYDSTLLRKLYEKISTEKSITLSQMALIYNIQEKYNIDNQNMKFLGKKIIEEICDKQSIQYAST